VKSERTEDDVPYFVTCTYCGTQTQLSLKQLESDKPLKCRTCGAPFKVVPPAKRPPKKPVKKTKKPFNDYDALLAERHDYERRTEAEFKKTIAIGIIIGALYVTVLLFLVLFESC
jgi:hypothetical protein